MCGFVSLFSDEPLAESQYNAINSMSEMACHRGPDKQSFFVEENVCFGFNRLSIIDPENGHQPFSYDNGAYTIVFNGEIYNYIELRQMLIEKGVEIKTESDTEVIVALYKWAGKDLLDYLRGMFGFVIWDRHEKKIFGARDPYGMKPFYYREENGLLYCASELKSILMLNSRPYEINHRSLQQYFTFQYVPGTDTLFEGFKVLEPGCTIEKQVNGPLKIERYFNIRFNPVNKPFEEKVANIRGALEESVSIHMRSDVPVGLFLSGGIDSTIITALASRINPEIKTFTVGFEREGFSEIDYAKETADELGLVNYSKIITHEEFIEELPRIVWHMDMPVADPAAVALYFVAREAAKHVRVVLSGEGSDELFGGYNIYCEPDSLKIFGYIPGFIKKFLKNAAHILPKGMKGKSFIERGCTPLEERYVGNALIFTESEKRQLINNYNPKWTPSLITGPLFDEVTDYDPVEKMQYIDINTWLWGDILVKADRMTMAHSLESRMPFLDKKVQDAASQLYRHEKVNNMVTKLALRKAFEDIIPEPAVNRRKLGFPVPIRHWLKNEIYSWAENLIEESKTDEYINKDMAIRMLKKHRDGLLDYSRKLWTVLIFMLWHRIYVEGAINIEPPVKGSKTDS